MRVEEEYLIEHSLSHILAGYNEIELSTSDPKIKIKAFAALLEFVIKSVKPGVISARIATERFNLIQRITGKKDIYSKDRDRANKLAIGLLPEAEAFVSSHKKGYGRFRAACLVSMIGNVMDIIPEHFDSTVKISIENYRALIREAKIVFDQTQDMFNIIRKANSVLFLTDNAGEIAFDTILVREIRNFCPEVVVAVKEEPILNDALLSDAMEVGMDKVADELIVTGSNTVGLFFKETCPDFRRRFQKTDIIIAKGIGHYETLTEEELEKPCALLFSAKISQIADYLRVPLGSYVAMLLK